MSLRIIRSPACAWHAVVMGEDLLVRGALASFFGGDDDPEDDGQTACGFPTKGNPDLLGCALPIPTTAVTGRSPLPVLPWGIDRFGHPRPLGTQVEVKTPDGNSILIPLIDVGPDLSTNHAIDLTKAAFVKLGGDPDDGLLSVDFRIIGGAIPFGAARQSI